MIPISTTELVHARQSELRALARRNPRRKHSERRHRGAGSLSG